MGPGFRRGDDGFGMSDVRRPGEGRGPKRIILTLRIDMIAPLAARMSADNARAAKSWTPACTGVTGVVWDKET